MKAIHQFDGMEAAQLPAKPLHLAVGMFDGLHLGHQAVINQAVAAARADGGVVGVLTFWPHPSALFRPQDPTRLIMTPKVKARVLERLGVDALITQPFTVEFAGLKAEDFLGTLRRHLPNLAVVYVGENWRFGRGRMGDVALLQREAASCELSVVSVPRVRHEDEAISSTRIRTVIEQGGIEQANDMLGYPYFAEGRVMPGKGLGRKIGFPTLNLNWSPELRPRYGVYAVRVSGGETDATLPGVANYGVRPTVERTDEPRLEVNVLGECPFRAGDELTVELHHFLRAEQKFTSVDELKGQIERDREQAARMLGAT